MFGNTIIAKLETEIAKKPYIIGFVLVGSYARKEVYGATEFSDLEAYVITEESDTSKVEKGLVEIVGKLGKVIFHYKNRWSGFSVVFENLFRLELPVVNGSDIKNVFSDKKRCIPLTEKIFFLYSYYRDQGTLRLILRTLIHSQFMDNT